MGEQIRRLDYQRRSKKSLMVDTGSGQKINKEYSTQVRAANGMEDRKKDIFIKSMEKHKKIFLDRFYYDKKVMIRFKAELDAKSEAFNELKFQQLRGQSAKNKLKSNRNTDIGPVTEIIPRHYYRGESTSAVKFDVEPSDENDEKEVSIEEENERNVQEYTRKRTDSFVSTFTSWTNAAKKPPSSVLRRRRMSLGFFDNSRFLPARDVRRQSAPPNAMSALPPRDIKSASAALRRSSRSSIGSLSSCENINTDSDSDASGRSYRMLREAFKKKKIEISNPQQDKLNMIKTHHLNETADIYERTIEKFEELFSDTVFLIY